MFTQCPECQIAFRVTAKVLQQAGGKVRCGGCDNAFNALDHLSESMPEATAAPDSASAAGDDLDETSKRLLKTLDELAGPEDVRIEDTGVEWRVLDETEAAIQEQGLKDPSDTGSLKLYDDDDAELDSSAAQESLSLDEPEEYPEERRYDDNTPLPDDFDDEDYVPPKVPQRRASDKQEDNSELDELQADLALSDPSEWTDLLDEVSEAIPIEVEEELAAIHDELTTRGSPGSTDDVGEASGSDEVDALADAKSTGAESMDSEPAEEITTLPVDLDAQFEMQAEALGITGAHEVIDANDALTDEVPLLDESLENIAEIEDDPDDLADLAAEHSDSEDEDDAMDVELDSTEDNIIDEGDSEEVDVFAAEIDEDLESTSEFEAQIDMTALALDDEADDESDSDEDTGDADEDEEDSDELADEADEADEEISLDEVGTADAEDLDFEESDVPDLIDDVDSITDRDIDDPVIELEVENAEQAMAESASEAAEDDDEVDEDEDAVAESDAALASAFGSDHANRFFDENSGEVETIIMEGESIRGGIEMERLAAEKEAKERIAEASKLADTYAMNRGKVRGGRRSYDPPSYVIVIGIVVLTVGLLAQFVHASRDQLVKSDLFNQTVAPIYRLLGQPIRPEWNVKGWQFESTNGSTDDNEEVLTVVSRIANKAEVALPYPLVHVSLTDRWEEVIGSRVLEPNEYLAGDLDPSRPVTPGEDFTAVITIEDPDENATGFKLNVCYRVVPGRVRCAIEDFKD